MEIWRLFFLALNNVIEARERNLDFAKEANISREELKRIVSKKESPNFMNLLLFLKQLV
jgi:DNA-binding phage protein